MAPRRGRRAADDTTGCTSTTVRRAAIAGSDQPTFADVALYTYTAHAPEGGVALDNYTAVREWLARVEGLSGFTPMARPAVGLRADG